MTADHSASPALALDATQLRTLLDDAALRDWFLLQDKPAKP